ncbi:MAG: hypothetical protein R3350_10855, partial [Saprospiraceae bacterium]|nr:hypothetical protein [Saprospiraceae bacterium]
MNQAMINNAQPNPLLSPPESPFGSVPFSRIQTEHFLPALEASLEDAVGKLDAIASSSEPPTFENTIEALESLSEDVDYVSRIYFNLFSADADEPHRELAQEISPRLTHFNNDVMLNAELFRRVKAVYDAASLEEMAPEPRMLLEKTFRA